MDVEMEHSARRTNPRGIQRCAKLRRSTTDNFEKVEKAAQPEEEERRRPHRLNDQFAILDVSLPEGLVT